MALRAHSNDGKLNFVKKTKDLTITYSDLFDFKALYEMMHNILVDDLGYEATNTDGSDAFEYYYWEKRKAGTAAKDYSIWWRLVKKIGSANGGNWRYILNVDFLGLHVDNTEIMHEGKKVKLQKGEINIFINGYAEMDFDDSWNKGSNLFFYRSLLKNYKSRTMTKDVSYHKKQFEGDVKKFYGSIKTFLDLKPASGQYPFHGKQGRDWK